MTESTGEGEKEARTISKWMFHCLVFGVMTALFVTEMIAVIALVRIWGLRIESYLLGGLAMVSVPAAYLIVDRLLLKPLGYSKSGKTLEVRSPTQLIAEGELGDDEVVELHLAQGALIELGLASLARADASGITGHGAGFDPRRKFVPWSKVATCEVETYHDSFGAPAFIRPIFKGSNGETLLVLDLSLTNIKDQQRLVNYIKAKLPKPKDDLFD